MEDMEDTELMVEVDMAWIMAMEVMKVQRVFVLEAIIYKLPVSGYGSYGGGWGGAGGAGGKMRGGTRGGGGGRGRGGRGGRPY